LILHARLIFLKGATYQKYGVKNIFHEHPVEVRSFDGTGTRTILNTKLLMKNTANEKVEKFSKQNRC
jgi:hypothetical protein